MVFSLQKEYFGVALLSPIRLILDKSELSFIRFYQI
jgi:hypothetical protein